MKRNRKSNSSRGLDNNTKDNYRDCANNNNNKFKGEEYSNKESNNNFNKYKEKDCNMKTNKGY